jgi:hypothetical protein
LVTAAVSLAAAGPAAAQLAGVYVTSNSPGSGFGVLTGNVIQLPISAPIAIQVCNNNAADGLVAVSFDLARGPGTC